MKQTLTCLLALLWLALPALAQTADPLRQKLTQVFAPLDKSQVPTGRLAEYATPLIGLHHFGGTLADSALEDMDVLRHLYATALSSRIYGQDTLPSVFTLNQRLAAAAPATASAPLAVAVLSLSYARLRPDAETAGLVSIQNEQVYDVPGRAQSPYQTQALFAAAPERSYAASPTVQLVLRRNLYLAEGQPGTPTPYLDFADGQGYRPATWNVPLGTTYATGGRKRVRLKLVYISGKGGAASYTRESWFVLHVPAPNHDARYTANLAYTLGAGFDQPFAPTTTYPPAATDYTHHLGAMVNVRYGRGHTSIVKPFIVVEGYNTATIAPHLVGDNNKNNDIESFLRSIDVVFQTGANFNDALEQAGYDLIYIDFNYGTDDIRRNAALFEEVVQWVNGQKQAAGSQEPNVVMGESMGGLVARYGLARLARSGTNPQTRLLVLHDSPQRGANNPMGLQALTRMADFPVPLPPGNYAGNPTLLGHTSDLSIKLKEALRILEAPATRQFSLKSVTGIDYEYEDNSFIDGPYKDVVDFGGKPAGGLPPHHRHQRWLAVRHRPKHARLPGAHAQRPELPAGNHAFFRYGYSHRGHCQWLARLRHAGHHRAPAHVV